MKIYIKTIVIQSVGPILMSLLTFSMARYLGSAEQGKFFSAKSNYDLIVSCFVFGFPQSIILEINHKGASRKIIYDHTILYGLFVFAALIITLKLLKPDFTHSFADEFLFSLSVSLIVIAYLWRAIFVTVDDGVKYSLVTTMPTFLLALSCLFFALTNSNVSSYTNEIFFCCAAGTVYATYLFVRPRYSFLKEGNKPSQKLLLTRGVDAFLLSLSVTAQIFLTYQYLQNTTDNYTMGYFSVALATSNILAFPLQALSPIFLNRWSSMNAGDTAIKYSRLKILWPILIILSGVIYAASALIPKVLIFIAGPEFEGAFIMIQIMVIYTAVLIVQRIATLKLVAIGNIRFGTVVAIGRISIVSVVLFMMSDLGKQSGQVGDLVCLVWLSAEIIATFATLLRVKKYAINE